MDAKDLVRNEWFQAKAVGMTRAVLNDLYHRGFLDSSTTVRTSFYRLHTSYTLR